MRLLTKTLFWIGGVFVVWATARVWLLGHSYLVHYAIAGVVLLGAVVFEPVMVRLLRRREPF